MTMVSYSRSTVRFVSLSYGTAEITGIAAADLVHDLLSMLLTAVPRVLRMTEKDEL